MTFSIVAADLSADPPEWGVAVASKFPAVGAVVPWARAGGGAIATQALANVSYGPTGLDHLAGGGSAAETVDRLTRADEGRADRQVGVVDAEGRAATYTGSDCFDWAGGLVGDGFCCQGNILASGEVIAAMREAFTSASGQLAQRLLAALSAGDHAGGDRRGRQSAALLVVREGGAYGGGADVAVDLRVDDHEDPVNELHRLFEIHRLVFPRPEDLRFVPFDDALRAEVKGLLAAAGHRVDDATGLHEALFAYAGVENLEERWKDDPDVIEQGILDHLRRRA